MAKKKQEEVEPKEQILAAVLYTDGSAINYGDGQGSHGAGVHGYIYDMNAPTGKTSHKNTKYATTTLGYVEAKNAKKGTVIVNPLQYVDYAVVGTGVGTNSIGELDAFIYGINYALKHGCKEVTLNTDSTYTMHVHEGASKTDYADIRRNEPKNMDRWIMMKEAIDAFEAQGGTIRVKKVRAHDTDFGNNIADRLAFMARHTHMHGKDVEMAVLGKESEPKGYWASKPARNPLLEADRFFFITNNDIDFDFGKHEDGSKRYVYKTLKYKELEDTGKRDNGATCGYIVVKEPDALTENVREKLSEAYGNTRTVATVDVGELYSAHNYRYLNIFGDSAFVTVGRERRNPSITVVGENIVASRLYPPGQAKHAIENDVTMGTLLNAYFKWFIGPDMSPVPYEFIDITSYIYTKDAKDRQIIKPEIGNNADNTTIPYDNGVLSIDIPVHIGIDCIARNQLKKLEKHDVKVALVVENHNNKIIKYYTVVNDMTTGSVGVFCSYYANKIYVVKEGKK